MNSKLIIIFLFFIVFLSDAQNFIFHSDSIPVIQKNIIADSNRIDFAIISDLTSKQRFGVFEKAIRTLNLIKPNFVMSIGDLTDLTEDNTEKNKEIWHELKKQINHLTMPFFFTAGNNDYMNEETAKLWTEQNGKNYYSFVYKNVLFVCLNTEADFKEEGSISDKQFQWLEQVLDSNDNVKWSFVFMHKPLWLTKTDSSNWSKIETMLKNRKYTVFAGHHHNYLYQEIDNKKYIVLSNTGGGQFNRSALGEFSHIVKVSFDGNNPTIANIMLDGVFDDKIVTPKWRNLIDSNYYINLDTIYFKQKTFKQTSSLISIDNPFDFPIRVAIKVNEDYYCDFNWYNFDKIIEANTSEIIELKIKADRNLKIDKINDISLNTSISYFFKDKPTIKKTKKNTTFCEINRF